ncbi:MAG: ArsC family reductase [Porticoccaceae bacterium]
MTEVILYGIKNCDTVKKARRWLDESQVAYRFHDVRADGLSLDMINQWIAAAGWEKVLNRAGTTWRKLAPEVQQQVNADNVAALLLEQPAMIKRPVLDQSGAITIGFKPDLYATRFNS